jgi:hypothetical protein
MFSFDGIVAIAKVAPGNRGGVVARAFAAEGNRIPLVDKDCDFAMDVNDRNVLNFFRAAVPRIQAADGGKIRDDSARTASCITGATVPVCGQNRVGQ